MNTFFNGHPGRQTKEFFVFYGLLFDDIIEVSKFLKHVPLGNWKGKNYKGYKYLIDKELNKIYFYGDLYDSDMDIRHLINFLDAENK